MPTLVSPTDAIVSVTRTTICGTNLHILKGDVPTCEPSRILGHKGALIPSVPASMRQGGCSAVLL
jgi:threonine dehydrogenase-like Zn-dependent dehydrogenase